MFTSLLADPGFWIVRYSWNPGRVEPSANAHDWVGRRGGSSASEPFTWPMLKSWSKKSERSATIDTGETTPIETPVRPCGTTVGTSTVVRLWGASGTVVGWGGEPSSK